MKDAASDAFIERLRDEADIVAIVSDYVPLKKNGKNYWGCCPFHHEKTPSFSVTPDKGFYYCFGCQTGGNVFNFVMKIENIGFWDAAKRIAQKMNIPLPEREKSPQELAREREIARLRQVNGMAGDFFHACLTKTGYGKAAREYLTRRGLKEDVITKFRLGFAPPAWDKLSRAFQKRGVDEKALIGAGLAVERGKAGGIYDRFRNRVMFPICDERGRIIGFGGRVLDDSQPKYLNSPETVLFNKRTVLFGLDQARPAIREAKQSIVVEGYMDAIAAHAAGVRHVVASLGTAFAPEQARKLLKQAPEIVFAYDSDAAGQNATLRALEIVRKLGASVKVIALPDGKDPDEFIGKHGADAFRRLAAEAKPLLRYQIDRAFAETDFSGLEGKVAVVTKVIPYLAAVDNAVEINAHIARVSQRLDIDESAIRSELQKFLRRAQKDKNVKSGQNIKETTLGRKIDSAVVNAGRHIIHLLWEDHSIIPYVQAQLNIEEFQNKEQREIICYLLESYNKREKPDEIAMSQKLSEKSNAEFLYSLSMDMENQQNRLKLIDDCIKTIRLSRLNGLYEQHRLQADELQRMGDSSFLQELAQSQRIKDEINKLYSV